MDPQMSVPEIKRVLCIDHGMSEANVNDLESCGFPPGTLLQLILKFGKTIIPLLPVLLPVIVPFFKGQGDIGALIAAIEAILNTPVPVPPSA